MTTTDDYIEITITPMDRLRLFTAKQALEINLKHNGRMELTANGARLAVLNVITPLTGKDYLTPSGRLTAPGKREALADVIYILDEIDKAWGDK